MSFQARLVAPLLFALASLTSHANQQGCPLYPIAMAKTTLLGVAPNTVIPNIMNGQQAGNFGWLTWNGAQSVGALVTSLTPPGNSSVYVNPDNPTDTAISLGDWVKAKTGVSNSSQVRNALDALIGQEILVPVWDQTRGNGANGAYRVCGFAAVKLISYSLPGNSKITARFMGFRTCEGQNLAPVVDAGGDQTVELPASASLTGSVTDDGQPLGAVLGASWTKLSGPGSVSFGCSTCLVTTATFTAPGVHVLRLSVTDGVLTGTDDVEITVNQPNQPPVAHPGSATLPEDTPTALTLSATDPENQTLTWTITTPPAHGALSGTAPSLVYTPLADYSGDDQFEFKVNDGALDSSNAVVTITVTPVNDPPIAESIIVTNIEDTVYAVLLPGSDVDSPSLLYSTQGVPEFGFLSPVTATNRVEYTPSENFAGMDTFDYTLFDGEHYATGEVVVLHIPVNDAPVATPAALSGTEDTDLAVSLAATDPDNAVLIYTVTAAPAHGTLSGTPPALVYTPAPDWHGADTFFFTASDGLLVSAPAAVTLTIAPVNDPPTAQALAVTTPEDTPAAVPLQGYDADGDALSFTLVDPPTRGTLTGTAPGFTYLPFNNEYGSDTFTFTVSDGQAVSAPAVVALTITPVNDAPVVDAGPDLTLTAGVTNTLNGVITDDAHPGLESLLTGWVQVSGPASAVLLQPTNAVSAAVFPAPGTYTLRLFAYDGEQLAADFATITVLPAGPNQAPVVNAGPDTELRGTNLFTLQGAASDDGLPGPAALTLAWSQLSGPTNAVFASTTDAAPSVTFPADGLYVLQFSATDGDLSAADTVEILVSPPNRAPVVTAGPDLTLAAPVLTLGGRVEDDGLPTGAPLTLEWTQLAGPAPVLITPPGLGSATAAFPTTGVYRLRVTASDTEFTVADEVEITVAGNLPPVVDAGPDLVVDIASYDPALYPPVQTVYPSVVNAYRYDAAIPGLNGDFIASNGNAYLDFGVRYPHSLAAACDDVFVAGQFGNAGTNAVRGVAYWDGKTWSAPLDFNIPRYASTFPYGPLPPDGFILQSPPSGLSVTLANGIPWLSGGFLADANADGFADFLARNVTNRWLTAEFPLVTPFVQIRSLASGAAGVYAVGSFAFNGGAGPINGGIALWNGSAWTNPFGEIGVVTNTSGQVLSAFTFTDVAEMPSGGLVAGGVGELTTPHGVARGLAWWNGTDWRPMGAFGHLTSGGWWNPADIRDIEVTPSGDVIVSGFFSQVDGLPVRNIARGHFDPLLQLWLWDDMAGGLQGEVNAVVHYEGEPYAAGYFFDTGAGLSARSIARWDGTSWQPVGAGVNGAVTSMAAGHSGLWLGGNFTTANGQPAGHIVKYGKPTLPLLTCPEPVVQTLPPGVTNVTVTLSAQISHPCGKCVDVIFNVDGGLVSQTVQTTSTNGPAAQVAAFTHDFPPGVHEVEIIARAPFAPDVVCHTRVAILAPATVALDGVVTDDGLPSGVLTSRWVAVEAPAPVGIAADTHPASSATFTQPGVYVFHLIAGDTQFTVLDEAVVVVRAPGVTHNPPLVDAGPDRSVLQIHSLTLSASVADDGLPNPVTALQWSQVSGPGPAVFSAPASQETVVTFPAPGDYRLRLTADDGGFAVYDELTVHVLPGVNTAPGLTLAGPRAVTLPNDLVLSPVVTDDGLPSGTLQGVTWAQVSGPAPVDFFEVGPSRHLRFTAPGLYVVRATVTDGELTTSADATIQVLVENPPAPFIALLSPDSQAVLTAPAPVVGTFTTPYPQSWTLQYRRIAENCNQWVELASGSGVFTETELAGFDTTKLPNGHYEIKLTGTDLTGVSVSDVRQVVLDGDMKVGAMVLTMNDFTLPITGLPVSVGRSYNSHETACPGDFGHGWDLVVSSVRLHVFQPLGQGWQTTAIWPSVECENWAMNNGPQPPGQLCLPSYCVSAATPHLMAIELPDGKLLRFIARIKYKPTHSEPCRLVAPWRHFEEFELVVEPLPGTIGTLRPLGVPASLYLGDDQLGAETWFDQNVVENVATAQPFADATGWEYTAQDGRVLTFAADGTLLRVTDANGNTFDITANGLFHSNGQSVTWQRDGQGRITSVTDPRGNSIQYVYDGFGDLVSVVDRAGHATGYAYDDEHQLLRIRNALGVDVLAAEYDADQRLVAARDAQNRVSQMLHNMAARTETVVNPLGHATTVAYNLYGNPTEVVDPLGGVTRYTYDTQQNPTSVTDPLGHRMEADFDASKQITRVVDAGGSVFQYAYDAQHRLTHALDALGLAASFAYDAKGNVSRLVDALDHTNSVVYTTSGQVAEIVDAAGNTIQRGYDALDRLISETDATGAATTRSYDANNNLLTISTSRTLANGQVQTETVTHLYDANDRRTATIDALGHVHSTAYDAAGRVVSNTDPLGRVTQYEYDPSGRPTRTIQPDGTFTSTAYDAAGRMTSTTDTAGRTTLYEYDALGRQTRVEYADGTFTTSVYDAAGRMTSTTDALGHTTSYTHDALGRTLTVTDPEGGVTRYEYDSRGRTTAMEDANGNTTVYEYDAADRQTRVEFADGTATTREYDAVGRMIAQTDPLGHTTRFVHDGAGRLLSVTNALGHATHYAYDEAGNQVSQTDALGRVTRFAYDALGRRTSRTLPLGMSETLSYDPIGNLLSRVDFNGRVTTFHYDGMDRLTRRVADPAFAEPDVQFTYRPDGQRASMTDATGVTTYGYDAMGRLIEKATPQGTLRYEYDDGGNLTRLHTDTPGGADVVYAYDGLSRLASLTDPGLPTIGQTSAYGYDPAGNLATVNYANGVSTGYGYDALNRLTLLTASSGNLPGSGGGINLLNTVYTLDAAGRRAGIAESGPALVPGGGVRNVLHTYDAVHRLLGEQHSLSGGAGLPVGASDFTYDAVGNRLTQTSTLPGTAAQVFQYDANDRLLGDTHDANGNTLLGTVSQPAGQEALVNTAPAIRGADAYDSLDRLRQRAGADGTVALGYDGDGNLVSETVTEGGVTTVTTFLVDDLNPTGWSQVVEEKVGGVLSRVYTYGHDLVSQRVAQAGSGWSVSFFGYDGSGSVRFLTDAAGAVTDTYTYDAYGRMLRQAGTTDNAYLYSGERMLGSLGLVHLRARLMNPLTGRFWTMDEFEGYGSDPATLHKYLYAGADPVNRVDPGGGFAISPSLVGLMIDMAFTTWLSHNMGALARSEAQLEFLAMYPEATEEDLIIQGAYAYETAFYQTFFIGMGTSLAISTVFKIPGVALGLSASAKWAVNITAQRGSPWLKRIVGRAVGEAGETVVTNTAKNTDLVITGKGTLVPAGKFGGIGGIRIQGDVAIGRQLAGRGQLAALRRNPNFKGVNIEELLLKTPNELIRMEKAGSITGKTLKQILKAFEGRDLRKGQ